MALSDRLVKLPEMAEALERTPDWVKRNWLRLHRDCGMPRKCSVGWQWPRGAMEAWLDAGAAVPPETEDDDTPPPASGSRGHLQLVANQNRLLAERYAGGRA